MHSSEFKILETLRTVQSMVVVVWSLLLLLIYCYLLLMTENYWKFFEIKFHYDVNKGTIKLVMDFDCSHIARKFKICINKFLSKWTHGMNFWTLVLRGSKNVSKINEHIIYFNERLDNVTIGWGGRANVETQGV